MKGFSSESQAPMRRFGVVGPSTLLVLDPENGREIEGGNGIGAPTIPDIKSFLDRAGARAAAPRQNPITEQETSPCAAGLS
jgi:hypothetical protein